MPGGHGDSLWWLGCAPEIQALKRLARDHPHAVRPEVAESYRFARLNSISTLQAMQRAGESLLPVAGVRYHTIAGDLHGQGGDGVVPLASAWLPGADSARVVDHGHTLYSDPEVIAQVLGILHEERLRTCDAVAAPR